MYTFSILHSLTPFSYTIPYHNGARLSVAHKKWTTSKKSTPVLIFFKSFAVWGKIVAWLAQGMLQFICSISEPTKEQSYL